MGGVTPRGIKIRFVKGGINISFWIILWIIKRRRSGSFCFNKYHEIGVGTLFNLVSIEGLFTSSDFSQHFLICESNSLTKNHRGFKKKKDNTKGKGVSFSSTELIKNVKVNIWWKSYQSSFNILFFSVKDGICHRWHGELSEIDSFASECMYIQKSIWLKEGIMAITLR